MEHKVFYGEYSLKHWIDLMLKGRILIPEFQRSFVWKEDDVKKLIKSFEDESFIPPVMIGAYNKEDNKIDDYIIDGQQRLSSILLAWLNKFPPKKQEDNKVYANDNDDKYDDDDIIIDWTFREIQDIVKQNKTIKQEEIVKNLKEYSELSLSLPNEFLEYRLGFSYIKPSEQTKPDDQKKFYAKLFRNINTTGVNLLNMEARKALYWFGGNKLNEFFAPNFTKNIKINNDLLDFARVLALLSECKKHEDKDSKINYTKIAKGHGGKKFESYVLSYIDEVIKGNSERFYINSSNNYEDKMNNIKDHIKEKNYTSIIDADYELFGLIYVILFKNKHIIDSEKESLEDEIKKINKKSDDEKKTPSSLMYIRKRLKESIEIYEKYSRYNGIEI